MATYEHARPSETKAYLDTQLELGGYSLSELRIASAGKDQQRAKPAIELGMPVLNEDKKVIIYPHTPIQKPSFPSIPISQETIDLATTHYEKLREFGMKVISFAFEMRTDSLQDATNDQALIATKIGKSKMLSDDNKVSKDKAKSAIIQPLENYIDWCLKTSSGGGIAVLASVSSIESYAQNEENEVFLKSPTPDMYRVEAGSLSVMHQFVADENRFLNSVVIND
jgi:hypothetical protein